jgi:hypothetical protein
MKLSAGAVFEQVKTAALMSTYALGGRVGNGWLTDLSVGVLNKNISGGVPAFIESGIAAVLTTLTGVGISMALGEEVGIGWMIGGYMIASENLVLTYGGKAASEAMRPLGGYSQMTGYSRMAGYSRPLRGAILPAFHVPRRFRIARSRARVARLLSSKALSLTLRSDQT